MTNAAMGGQARRRPPVRTGAHPMNHSGDANKMVDPSLVYNLRSLARFEHADLSIGDEAADLIERQAAEIARLQAGGCARDQTTTQYCVEAGDAGMCAGASNNNAPSCYEQSYKALAAYRLSTLAPLREAMNLKPDLAEADVIKAAKTLRHIYDQVLYTSSSHPFICGTIGDIGHNGLHEGYFICPAYGADVQCTEVYIKKSAIQQLSDN